MKKSVLVEKPLTLNSKHAKELHELALKNKVTLMVGHVLLFHPAFQKIKELILANKLGKIQYLYSNRLNLGTIRTEENVFWSFAPHDVALFQYLTDSFPIEIHSKGTDILQNGIEDTTVTTFKYPNNIMGHIFVSWLHPFKEHRFIVIGSKGMVSFDDASNNKSLVFYDKTINWKKGKPVPKNGKALYIDYKDEMPLELELKYFMKNINRKPKIANSKSALDVINILETTTKSLKNE